MHAMCIFMYGVPLFLAALVPLSSFTSPLPLPAPAPALVVRDAAPGSGGTVITGSFMRKSDAHYLISGYRTLADPALPGGPVQSFITKRLLSSERHVWRLSIPGNSTRLQAVSSSVRGTKIAGAGAAVQRLPNGTLVYRMFLATFKVAWGPPRPAKTMFGAPQKYFEVRNIVCDEKYVVVCAQAVPLGNSSASGAVAYVFNAHLKLQWLARRARGDPRDACADILLSSLKGSVFMFGTAYGADGRPYGTVDAYATVAGTSLYSEVITGRRIGSMVRASNMQSAALNENAFRVWSEEGGVILERMVMHDSSFYVVGRIVPAVKEHPPRGFLFKLSMGTGMMLWAHVGMAQEQHAELEYQASAGVTTAMDEFVYVMARYKMGNRFANFGTRISTFNDFNKDKDLGKGFLVSNNSKIPFVGLLYSEIRGAVLGFGQKIMFFPDGDGNGTFSELPFGPVTNKMGLPLCSLCEGVDFIIICFDLVSTNVSLVKASDMKDMFANMFRLPRYQVRISPTVNTVGNEESVKVCCRAMRVETGISSARQELENKIRFFIVNVDRSGKTFLERLLDVPKGTMHIRDGKLNLESKGKVVGQDEEETKKSFRDMVDEAMNIITLGSAGLALLATLGVGLILSYRFIRDNLVNLGKEKE